MKKLVLLALITMSATANADMFLSKDICSVDFSNLMSIYKNRPAKLTKQEKQNLLSDALITTSNSCLKSKTAGDYSPGELSTVDKISCPALPAVYYADKNGVALYRFSNSEWETFNAVLRENSKLSECLAGVLGDSKSSTKKASKRKDEAR